MRERDIKIQGERQGDKRIEKQGKRATEWGREWDIYRDIKNNHLHNNLRNRITKGEGDRVLWEINRYTERHRDKERERRNDNS